MDRLTNPYAPGAGRSPAAFVGRGAEIDSWLVALRRTEAGRGTRPIALYGLRGVGKTVLLNRMRRDAADRDWLVAKIEAGAGKSLRESLGEALYGPLSDHARPAAGKRLLKALKTALTFKASYDTDGSWTFGLDLRDAPGGGADSGVLETDLAKLIADLSGGAAESGVGLAVLVDEAQDLSSEELIALCAVAHQASQDDLAFLLVVAGLPSLPRDLAEAKSYAERLFEYHDLQALPPELAAQALTMPAADEGVSWEPEAIDHVVGEAAGYPYFLQQFGESIWNTADGPQITLTDARVGTAYGLLALDSGFYRSRWDRATPTERDYLRAMAADGDEGSSSSEIARRLRRKPTSLGPVRAKLISKGIVYAPEHGRIAFTVPRMAAFIARQPAE